jgi:hypothetical protein
LPRAKYARGEAASERVLLHPGGIHCPHSGPYPPVNPAHRCTAAARASGRPIPARSTAICAPASCSWRRRWIAARARKAGTAVYLKAKGLDVLRALLRAFYSHLTGECFPSYDEIARAAGCARSTVAEKLRILERLGIIETIRRKVVASFTSRVHRVRFDVAVQTSNSYRFNLPIDARPQHGDLAVPLLKPQQTRRPQAESEFRAETSIEMKIKEADDLAADKAKWICALLGADTAG